MVVDYTFGQGNEDNAVLQLLQGAMDGVSGEIAKTRPEGMQILAKQATIGIRGTKIFLLVKWMDISVWPIGPAVVFM